MTSASNVRLVVVTGLSGSGKSIAIRQLEDSGFYCIDNLPVSFLTRVASDLRDHGHTRVAVSVDARSKSSIPLAKEQLANLASDGWDVRTLFLTASSPCLVRRYSETRRRHPLSLPNASGMQEKTLSEAIAFERELLSPLAIGACIIDTSDLPANTLREWVRRFSDAPESMMTIAFESFAFKHGIPVAADFVFDVRNLPNPYYDPELRPYTGRDKPIIDYLDNCSEVQEMIEDISRFIRKWLPTFESQHRHYFTVAIGCTGGQHRSVYVAETLKKRFSDISGTVVRHRQLSRKAEKAELDASQSA
ncbi:MAG TPA: RNase adapter RapZ [Sutterella sp.]|jgi:UPF0042 nucleotide-binding protein|nr:RNase adapter RapZ [Sutterella sp.]